MERKFIGGVEKKKRESDGEIGVFIGEDLVCLFLG